MAQWLNAIVTNRIDWNDHLFSLQFTCDAFSTFTAGQFIKVGIEQENGEILSRPYSLVNAPHTQPFEIMAVPVAGGSLSPKLHSLQKGDKLKVMSPATGFLTINEIPVSQSLFLLATGTGVGPFLSILKSDEAWQKYKNIVLVYGVRKFEDLAYLKEIKALEIDYSKQFSFVPITSREVVENKDTKSLSGRIPTLLKNQSIQKYCGLNINSKTTQVMLCGNPKMIQETIVVLNDFGLEKHLRRSPGHITTERYW